MNDGYNRLKSAGMVREGRAVGELLAAAAGKEPPRAGESAVYTLPWPPSVNQHTRHAIIPLKGKQPYIAKARRGYKLCNGFISRFLTDDAKEFREEAVKAIGLVSPISGEVAAEIIAYPPDGRRRDLDNLLKSTLDALQHAGVYRDDMQICRLTIQWGHKKPGGAVQVKITPLPTSPGLF